MLAVIPARGGSKGIPRKNLVPLLGRPLINYTIEAAQGSKLISRIILSTEDEEIVRVAESAGLEVSYFRPVELAADETSMAATLSHCLDWAGKMYGEPENFVLLQPTSPLRTSLDIDNAIERFRTCRCEWLFSVNEMSEHPYECIELKVSGEFRYLRKSRNRVYRRQDYEGEFYFINGAIYIYNYNRFRSRRGQFDLNTAAIYKMPRSRGLDIDDLDDLNLAEFILKKGIRSF